MARTAYPDGIDAKACAARSPRRLIAFRFLLFATILIAALFGVFGGTKARVHTVEALAATVTIERHDLLRNGNIFETRLVIFAKQPIADAVIAMPAALDHETTINTIAPDPATEEIVGGEHRLHLGPVEPGETLRLKIDGQLNPALFGTMKGDYRLLDGTRELARFAVTTKVLP